MKKEALTIHKENASSYSIHYSIHIDGRENISFPLFSSYSEVLSLASCSLPLTEEGSTEVVSYSPACSLPFIFLSTATAFRTQPVGAVERV